MDKLDYGCQDGSRNYLNNSSNKSTETEDLSDWISQAEAARIRRVSQQAISDLVTRGKLQTMQVGGRTFVRRSEVEAYTPDPGGRPRKKAAAKKKRIRKAQ